MAYENCTERMDNLLWSILHETIGVVTTTIATPAVLTLTAHGLITGDKIYLSTTGALPTGLTADTTVYYVHKINADTLHLSTTESNAFGGTYIATSGTQSGTHTIYFCPHGVGDGSTTFNVPDIRGRVVAGRDNQDDLALRLNLSSVGGARSYSVGANGGEQAHQLTTAELASHAHNMGNGTNQWVSGGNPSGSIAASITQAGQSFRVALTGTDSAGSDASHNNVQPTIVLNYVIKT